MYYQKKNFEDGEKYYIGVVNYTTLFKKQIDLYFLKILQIIYKN